MKTNEVRQKYLEFFKSKGHQVCPSDVLVPKWDNTVLFTPAGMNQFKDHFLGNVDLEFTRATTSQKCLRTGDIENVGRTAYHHTFFEMLGNFSFGDYFKRDAIHWAWEFLTEKKWLGIDSEKLTVSVFLDDDEASDIWEKEIGLPLKRIERLGEHDNFWPAGAPTDGPDGVCGPCSEIFFHPDNGPECEIWNLVFTQFNREGSPPDNLVPLPSKNIDTGMGLERIAAVLQGKVTNYHIDTLQPLVEAAAAVVGTKYEPDSENGRRLRRIADHVRACTMSIHENVYPGSQKEEYVIRRLLRRAVLQGHEMGLRDPFLYQLVPEVINQMGEPYPEIKATADRVAQVIKVEESNFLETLDGGLDRIESIFKRMESSNEQTVNGKAAADLYQTYGIPAELFASIADEKKLGFDWEGFKEAMDEHGVTSGKGSKGVMGDFGPLDDIKKEVKTTAFVGYEKTDSSAVVKGLVRQWHEEVEIKNVGGELEKKNILKEERCSPLSSSLPETHCIVLDSTPFYAESGGQVGDTGTIAGPNGKFEVTDTQKNGDVFVHVGKITEGTFEEGESVTATVDQSRRDAIRRAHSATHVLHYALQQTLGEHAQQRGSKVTPDLLRFDFSNLEAVKPEQLAEIERKTIDKVQQGASIQADILPLEEAKTKGAMMLFGEKYPDPVRMVSIGDYSKELCGGIHLADIGEVEAFEITIEESVSSGTRRIQALTGEKAKSNQKQILESAGSIAKSLGVSALEIPTAVGQLSDKVKGLKKQLSSGKKAQSQSEDSSSKVSKAENSSPEYLEVRDALRSIANSLNIPINEVADRVTSMCAEVEDLNQQLEKMAAASDIDVDDLISKAEAVGDVRIISMELPGANAGLMRKLIDQIRKKTSPVAIFFATCPSDSKVLLATGISRDLVDRGMSAGDWIKEIAPIVGGGGGGKPDLASAGGKNPEKVSEALDSATEYLKAKASASSN